MGSRLEAGRSGPCLSLCARYNGTLISTRPLQCYCLACNDNAAKQLRSSCPDHSNHLK